MSDLSRTDKFLNEGLVSYLNVRKCLKEFEQKIQKECSEFLRSKSAELREKLRVPKESDIALPYVEAYEDGAEIGAGIWDNDHYVCIGVVWENEIVRAYASRYVGGKKMANYVYNEIRTTGMIKEEADGWYLTIYEELRSHNMNSLSRATTSALNKWLMIGRKFSDARKKFHG